MGCQHDNWRDFEGDAMTVRTIQILERVQWFATAGAGAMIAAFALTVSLATGIDLIGWN